MRKRGEDGSRGYTETEKRLVQSSDEGKIGKWY